MANKKSSKKDIKNIEKRTERNRTVNTRIKTLGKKLKQNGDAETARDLISAADKAAKRGIIHKNKASRMKSRASKVAFAAV
ncbi:MAG: 30S ribosomal protein S20 [Verrucomicrobia bacterium CG_4_10_14_3_um_filter_43_23]|nr:MAG: hypothetical protein AUJ82_06530 [Verrucomicrobia bacterium CG1_02_43_26]PIP59795.1 MAG: 30S ribosomal protein S20 [Verrucomicrobia bacterium CG22_combo_CG10-13_8_21_14_all_43_17]PIX57802.1 MAG: 30S ribosomal protein S20 [Verrucomicrobia bacterium CG_4_10_14_3_um_filter_43_23]PIY60900.1 MAG: 30S ribosomal protein S20 [Verrucomicrobia bacterium CG_4_10_14_0_8_um_filter_43_34]PJA43495.1 MAG: 30S ribosomal protein S20 [Verrucomicrobia bacterium CG_4_9_14_3_um_filter_43_20]